MKHIGEFLTGIVVATVILAIVAAVWVGCAWIFGMLPGHALVDGHRDWTTGILVIAGIVLGGYVAELHGKIKAVESTLEFQAAEIRRLRGD